MRHLAKEPPVSKWAFMAGNHVFREVIASITFVLLVLLGTLASSTAGGSGPAGGNVLKNPGFEELRNGSPADWSLERRSAHKGTVSIERKDVAGGVNFLRLSPNSANSEAAFQLSVGQGFAAGPFQGKRIYISAWVGSEGGAVAVVGLYAVRKDGSSSAAVRLEQSERTEKLVFKEGFLDIPADDQTLVVVLTCSVEGTKGSAFFDNISASLDPPHPLPAAAVSKPAGGPLQAEAVVYASKEVREIPRTLYGTNIEWVFDGYGIWNQRLGSLDPEIVRHTKDLGVSLFRFPGGVFSDFYHWRDGVGPVNERRKTRQIPKGPKSINIFGTDEALSFADHAGGKLLLTVNAGTGTAEEAAAWVSYVNKNRRRVDYWEVGNELYINDGTPASKASTVAPADYARRFLEFAKAMRKADSTIKIGAIGGENHGRYIVNSYPDWNREVLSVAAKEMDFLAVHNAYAPMVFADEGYDVRTVYSAMLAAPQLIRQNLETLSRQIESASPQDPSRIKIAVTEWGPFFHAEPGSRLVDHVKTLGSALYVASVLKVFIESPRTEVANFFKLVDNAFMGWIGLKDGAYVPKAPYLAFQMYTQHFGSILVQSSTTSSTYDTMPVGFVDRVSGVPYLDVVASLSADRQKLHIIAVNKHLESPIRTNIVLKDFKPAGKARVWTLNGTGPDANTGTTLPQIPGLSWTKQAEFHVNPRFYKGSADEVSISESVFKGAGSRFEYSFPAHSVTAIELRRVF